MLVYQKTMLDRYYCMKSFCHLKNALKSSFLYDRITIMARKSTKDPYVLKTPVPEQRLTSIEHH